MVKVSVNSAEVEKPRLDNWVLLPDPLSQGLWPQRGEWAVLRVWGAWRTPGTVRSLDRQAERHRHPGVRARLVSHVRDVGRTPQAAGETTLLESQHVNDLPGRDQRLFTPPTVHFYLSGFHLDG